MPTKTQIEQALELARAIDPDVRIKRIGPDGVEFVYPDQAARQDGWANKPFGGRAA
jgi:hypothetical protein